MRRPRPSRSARRKRKPASSLIGEPILIQRYLPSSGGSDESVVLFCGRVDLSLAGWGARPGRRARRHPSRRQIAVRNRNVARCRRDREWPHLGRAFLAPAPPRPRTPVLGRRSRAASGCSPRAERLLWDEEQRPVRGRALPSGHRGRGKADHPTSGPHRTLRVNSAASRAVDELEALGLLPQRSHGGRRPHRRRARRQSRCRRCGGDP